MESEGQNDREEDQMVHGEVSERDGEEKREYTESERQRDSGWRERRERERDRDRERDRERETETERERERDRQRDRDRDIEVDMSTLVLRIIWHRTQICVHGNHFILTQDERCYGDDIDED